MKDRELLIIQASQLGFSVMKGLEVEARKIEVPIRWVPTPPASSHSLCCASLRGVL